MPRLSSVNPGDIEWSDDEGEEEPYTPSLVPPSKKKEVQDEITSIQLATAPAAARYLQKALTTGKADPVLLRAAVAILDRVQGRPAQRQEHDQSIDDLTALWGTLRDARVEDGTSRPSVGNPHV